MSFASVNGIVVPAEEARVSVLDNGFAFGDSVYEVLRTYGGLAFEPGRHFRRLRASAARLGFAVPAPDAALLAQVDALLARAGSGESYIRIIVSRGLGDCSYHFERVEGPTVVMIQKPLPPYPAWHYEDGIHVAAVGRPPQPPPGPRPRHQVEQPAQQHPGHARGPVPRRRGAGAPEPGGLRRRGREHQRVPGRGEERSSPRRSRRASWPASPARWCSSCCPGLGIPFREEPLPPRRPARSGRGVPDQHHARGRAGAGRSTRPRSGAAGRARSPGA